MPSPSQGLGQKLSVTIVRSVDLPSSGCTEYVVRTVVEKGGARKTAVAQHRLTDFEELHVQLSPQFAGMAKDFILGRLWLPRILQTEAVQRQRQKDLEVWLQEIVSRATHVTVDDSTLPVQDAFLINFLGLPEGGFDFKPAAATMPVHPLTITIPGYINNAMGFTEYIIDSSFGDLQYDVKHRFSDFIKLHTALQQGGHLLSQELPSRFPVAKSMFSWETTKRDRVDKLQDYLRSVVRLAGEHLPKALLEFLQIKHAGLNEAAAKADLHPALWKAVQEENLAKVREKINAGADVNWTHPQYDITPLMQCGIGDRSDKIAQLLIDNGADVDKTDSEGRTALFYSLEYRRRLGGDRIKNVRVLLAAKADPLKATVEDVEWFRHRYPAGSTPFDVARDTGSLWSTGPKPDPYCVLLVALAIPEAQRDDQWDAMVADLKDKQSSELVDAASEGDLAKVKEKIDVGANVNCLVGDTNTALRLASKFGHDKVAQLLIDNGADVELAAENGFTPLITASSYGHTKVARVLLDAKADPLKALRLGVKLPGSPDPLQIGCTALSVASRFDHAQIAQLLIDKGADVDEADTNGWTPLLYSAYNGLTKVARLLLAAKADPQKETVKDIFDVDAGSTFLDVAEARGHQACIDLLTAGVAASSGGAASAASFAVGGDGPTAAQLRAAMQQVLSEHPEMSDASAETYDKLNMTSPRQLTYVDAAANRRGILSFMCVDENVLLTRKMKGLDGLREEVAAFASSEAGQRPGAFPWGSPRGTAGEELSECLRYVLDEEAGSSPLDFQNGLKRDCDAAGVRLAEREVWEGGYPRGKRLQDFFADHRVGKSDIKIEHVAALRLYTTAAFKVINDPLRDMERRQARQPHPLPLIVRLLEEACKQLGAAEAMEADATQPKDLYRGMKGVALPPYFLRDGGVEIAPMSTTNSLKVAMEYSVSTSSVLLRIATSGAIKRGVGVRWLSAFPAEEEILYPPLTHMQAKGEPAVVKLGSLTWTVVTVEPTLP